MKYEEMSDFEINLAVAKMKYNHPSDPEYFKFYRLNNGNVVQVNAYKMWPQDLDFCNNPSDAWSIIIDNNISLEAESECTDRQAGCHAFTGSYTAYGVIHEDSEFFEGQGFVNQKDDNPLRAAMICYLKMKDSENE